jgi:hypothetical protein
MIEHRMIAKQGFCYLGKELTRCPGQWNIKRDPAPGPTRREAARAIGSRIRQRRAAVEYCPPWTPQEGQSM